MENQESGPSGNFLSGIDESFYEGLDLDIKDLRDSYDSSDKTFDDKVVFGNDIASIVGDAVGFRSLRHDELMLIPETLAESRRTNCYGQSIVVSEILESEGIDHFIAFVNQHAFVWMYDFNSERSHMLDAWNPELCIETTKYIGGNPPKEWQLGGGPLKHDISIYPRTMTLGIQDIHKRTKAESVPWLGMMPRNADFFRYKYQDEYRLPMRIYPSAPGRGILQLYHNSIMLDRSGNPDIASECMRLLEGAYPDVDPQNHSKFPLELIRDLMRENKHESALAVAKSFYDSLEAGDRTKQAFIYADTLRDIGINTGNAELLEQSIDQYDSLGFGGELRRNKREKAKRALVSLALANAKE